jgi:protein SCO1/2
MNSNCKNVTKKRVWAGIAALMLASGAWAGEEAEDSHAHHHHGQELAGIRSVVDYKIPEVKLVRDDGKPVLLASEINDGRPIVLTFIFTTCTSICPLSSQILSQLQTKLGLDRDRVHLMSVSIDPEEDTPSRLQAYAKKFNAGPAWQHYTGTVAASAAVQRAFDVYRGDKMSHTPVTLLRPAPGKAWVRIDGFTTADNLLAEIHPFIASR